jgi:uncharacterized protein YjbI with pentapeptide repeats
MKTTETLGYSHTPARARSALSSAVGILIAVAFGAVLAGYATHLITTACHDAGNRKENPGQPVEMVWRWIQVTADDCRYIAKSPPWLLLSGLAAAPAVLLTWFWGDTGRRDDHRLALESGIAVRKKEAAGMLSSSDTMTRINGLLSLWDIARESPSHRVMASRTLEAFVRVESAQQPEQTNTNLTAGKYEPSSDEPVVEHRPERATVLREAVTLLTLPEWAEMWNMHGAREPVDLHASNLAEFNFGLAHLQHAQFWTAKLQGADFAGAHLNNANFLLANLTKAVLADADLTEASLCAVFVEARLDNAILIKADLRGANLHRAVLTGANLAKAKLGGADMREAVLTDAADLTRANFVETWLENAILIGADLRGNDMRRAVLINAMLADAKLQEAELQGAILRDADLTNANLNRAKLQGASLWNAKCDGTTFVQAEYNNQTVFSCPDFPERHQMKKVEETA